MLSLTSCSISLPEYPSKWPSRLIGVNACPDLSGTYSNEAEVVGYSGKRHLSWFFSVPPTDFFQQQKGEIKSVIIDKIYSNKYRAHFLYLDGTKLEQTSELDTETNGTYCENGELVVAHPSSVGTSHGSFGKWTEVTRISKSTDGSLVIMKSLKSIVAVFYFIPTYSDEIVWERYKPYQVRNK